MGSTRTTVETKFPAGAATSESTHISETFGAFGELELTRNGSMPHRTPEFRQQYSPALRKENYGGRVSTADDSMDTAIRIDKDEPLLDAMSNGRSSNVYRPTTTQSEASAASTKKSYGRLVEVYSNSGDTVEFAHNLGSYLNNIVSPFVWIALLLLLSLWALVLIIVGSLNLPFCAVQPMIPIYLIVAGCLFILSAAFRIYNLWPMPADARKTSLGANLACRAIEGLLLIAILVWLVLGCIWTYGARRYVHYGEGMFERHYCEPGTYWVAFVNVTLHLALIALTILGTAIFLALGLWKETDVDRS